jgi:hypothetical protein
MKKVFLHLPCLSLALFCAASASASVPEASALVEALRRMDVQELIQHRVVVVETQADSSRKFRVEVGATAADVKEELLEVNGTAPDAETLEAFEKERAAVRQAEAALSPEEKLKNGLAAMVVEGSLHLSVEDGSRRVFLFQPVLVGMESVVDKLEGSLTYDLDSGMVTHMEVRSKKAFKPDLKVKIRHFLLAFEFVKIPGLPEPVLAKMETSIKGSAMLVASFEEQTTVSFSDYEPIGY